MSSLWFAWTFHDVQISIAETNDDILSLADLRYQEWISKDGDGASAGFRLATAEIYRDRKEDGSTVFLAYIAPSDDGSGENFRRQRSVVIGAAELTPIELKGVLIDRENNGYDHYTGDAVLPLYITDVVTSKAHRRRGIGSILMKRVEETAREMGSNVVFLHVDYANTPARKFYERMGYLDIDDSEIVEVKLGGITNTSEARILSFVLKDGGTRTGIVFIDSDRFANNAGTVGQLLMLKQLSARPSIPEVKVGLVLKEKLPTSEGGFVRRQKGNPIKRSSRDEIDRSKSR
jgi:ribosomal protein S18 acetylase RimI-like enzyme